MEKEEMIYCQKLQSFGKSKETFYSLINKYGELTHKKLYSLTHDQVDEMELKHVAHKADWAASAAIIAGLELLMCKKE